MSGPIIPSSGGGGGSDFSHQGSIDYTALVSSTVNWSVGFLNRFSQAGVDPYTYTVGQALCLRNFELGAYGYENVSKAVKALPSLKGYGDTLWFGFGIQSLARKMAETHEGFKLLALCGALSEIITDDYRTKILFEIVKESKAPQPMMPSHLQWSSLIKVCAGAFTSTLFSQKINQFSRLLAGPNRDWTSQMAMCDIYSTESSFARALLAIGRVSTGNSASVTISGASIANISWLAAFSEWVLGLNVSLSSSNYDNSVNPIYVSSNQVNPNATVQVLFVLSSPENRTSIPPTLDIEKTSYRINLDIKQMVSDGVDGDKRVFHRQPWEDTDLGYSVYSCLNSEDTARTFCFILGRSARLLESYCNGYLDDIHLQETLEHWIEKSDEDGEYTHNDTDFMRLGLISAQKSLPEAAGAPLIEKIVGMFPKLQAVKQDILQYYHEISISEIGWENLLEVYASFQDWGQVPSEQFSSCRVAFETVHYGRALAMIDNPFNINPASSINFRFWFQKRKRKKSTESADAFWSDIRCFWTFNVLGMKLFDVASGVFFESSKLLDREVITFQYRRAQSAVAKSGVCIFLNLMSQNAEGSLAHESLRVSVVPGIIEFEGRQYSSIENIYVDGAGENYRPLGIPSIDEVCNNAKALRFKNPPALLLSLSIGHLDAALDFLCDRSYTGRTLNDLGLQHALTNASIESLVDLLHGGDVGYVTCRREPGCMINRNAGTKTTARPQRSRQTRNSLPSPLNLYSKAFVCEFDALLEDADSDSDSATEKFVVKVHRLFIPLDDLAAFLFILRHVGIVFGHTIGSCTAIWTEDDCDTCLVQQIKGAIKAQLFVSDAMEEPKPPKDVLVIRTIRTEIGE